MSAARRMALLVALVVFTMAGAARAESPSTVATEVSHNVMSPFCPGLTLHDCPSDAATDLRARIESWAQRGRSRTEIMARLRAEYGPSIAASPEPRGRGLVVWLLPVVAVVVGAAVATVTLRRWSAPAPAASKRRELSSEERTRLDRELTRIRGEA